MPRRDHSYVFLKRIARSRLAPSLRRWLPSLVRRTLVALIDLPTFVTKTTDLRSLYRVLFLGSGIRGTEPVAVRMRFLSGLPVYLRPGTADVYVARNLAVQQPHLPPHEIRVDDARLVWDLGANIGLAAFDYAVRWPRARVIAVELEPENAELCRRNLSRFGQRCEVVQAAIWPTDGEIGLEARSSSDGSTLETNSYRASASAVSDGAIPAISLDTLLARIGEWHTVDYCKLDVEGAERSVLRGDAEWAKAVARIAVEVHGDYTAADCRNDLTRLGFHVCQGSEDNLVFGAHTPVVSTAGR